MRWRHKRREDGHGEVRSALHGHQDREGREMQPSLQTRPVRGHRVQVHQTSLAQRRSASRLSAVCLQVCGDEHTHGAVQRPRGGHASRNIAERRRVPRHRAQRR